MRAGTQLIPVIQQLVPSSVEENPKAVAPNDGSLSNRRKYSKLPVNKRITMSPSATLVSFVDMRTGTRIKNFIVRCLRTYANSAQSKLKQDRSAKKNLFKAVQVGTCT